MMELGMSRLESLLSISLNCLPSMELGRATAVGTLTTMQNELDPASLAASAVFIVNGALFSALAELFQKK